MSRRPSADGDAGASAVVGGAVFVEADAEVVPGLTRCPELLRPCQVTLRLRLPARLI